MHEDFLWGSTVHEMSEWLSEIPHRPHEDNEFSGAETAHKPQRWVDND